MKVGRKRLLAGLICAALVMTDISTVGFSVSAHEVEQPKLEAENDRETETDGTEDVSESESTTDEVCSSEESVGTEETETEETENETGSKTEEISTEGTETRETETDQDSTETETQEESSNIDGTEETETEGTETDTTETELVTTEEVELLEDGEVLSGKCGDNLTWTLKDGTLTISGKGEMYDYGYITNSAPWSYNDVVKRLVLEEGITKIGENAFVGCWDLSGNLIIPNSVTMIGSAAFWDCSGFTGNLTIPDSVTTVEAYAFSGCRSFNGNLSISKYMTKIEDGTFKDCSGLSGDLIIPENITSIGGGAFSGCSGFTGSLIISNNVVDIGAGAFSGCSSLTGDLIIPSGITIINYSAFSGCSGFTGKLVIPEGVTDIKLGAFSGCSGLTGDLVIPKSATNTEAQAFYNCRGLTGDLIIPDGETGIGISAFYGCSGLNGKLVIPDTVTIIYDKAFYGCSGLTGDLIIPDSVTSIGESAFYRCKGFDGSLIIGDSVTKIGSCAFDYCSGLGEDLIIGNSLTTIGGSLFSDCSFAGKLTIGTGVVVIGSGAFYGSNSFSGNLIIPDSVTTIGNSAFEGCNGFSGSLTIGTGVTSLGSRAFYGLSGLRGNLTIPNSVITIGESAFEECSGFNGNLTIGDSVTTIESKAFSGCSNLKGNLIIPRNIITIGESAFNECSGFGGDLTIPSSITSVEDSVFSGCSGFSGNLIIPNSVTSIGESAFKGCNGFSGNLTIPNSVTSIGESAFKGCNGFSGNLTIPNSVISIGELAFSGCSGFSGSLVIPDSVREIRNSTFMFCSGFGGNLTIPNGVTSIGESAFIGCSGFNGNLTIPNSVTSIGESAFRDCSSFNGSLTIPSSITSIEDLVFSGCSGFSGNLTISNSVTSIGASAFGHCSSFNGSLTIPSSVISIGGAAFSDCDGLIGSLVIPDSVITIGRNAFYNCSGFSGNLIIPNSITSIEESTFNGCNGLNGNLIIPNSITSIGREAFSGCSGLTGSLVIPNSVTSIGREAFSGCRGLNGTLTISNNVTSIGNSTFYNCNGFIGSLTIPDSVATIGRNAFYNCSSFTESLTIGNSVTMIEDCAFYKCSGLGKIYFKGKAPKIEYDSFYEMTAKVYYPSLLDGWESVVDQNYCGTLTWISYPAGTEPWTMDSNENMPDIWISFESDISDLLYDIYDGYSKDQFNLNVSTYFMGMFSDIESYEDIKVTVELPQGLSFSNDKVERTIIRTLDKLDSTNSPYKGIYPVYITDDEMVDEFVIIAKVTVKGYEMPQTNTYSITVSMKKPEYSPSDIESITKTDIIQDTAYGRIKYEPTIEGKIYDLVIEYNMALNDYLDAIKLSAKGDLYELNSGTSNIAAKLRQADEDASKKDVVVLMEADIPEDALNSVYETLAMYLDCYTQKAFELEIVGNNAIEIGVNIVNKVRNSMNQATFTREIGQYTVTFKTIGFGGANSGSVIVEGKGRKKYTGIINTSSKKTAELMTLYINDLSDTVRDLLKSALMSVFTELSDTMGISEYTKKELNSFLKDKVDLLRKNGYGDILKNTIKLRDTYEVIKDIIAAQNASDLQEVFSKASSIHKKIKNMDYSDDAVTKETIKIATDQLNRIKNNLEDTLYEYIYGTSNEDESFWGWFKKIFIECPVDFIVYDMNDNMLGYVDKGDVSYDEKILIKTSGDVKTLYIPADMEVKLKFIATGNGSMNYVIEEVQDKKITGRMNYYDVPLIKNETYFQTLTTDSLTNDVEMFPIKKSDGTTIYADEYISASDRNACIIVDCSADTGGVIIGNGKYPKGDPVELLAFGVDDTYEFCGWYVNDTLVELNNVYRFAALENVNVYAKFEKSLIASSEYRIVLEDFYDDFAWVDVYENEVNSEDVAMRLQGAEDIKDYEAVNVKRYLADGQCLSNIVNTEFDNVFSFWLRGVNLKDCVKTEIYDGSNRLIVTISQNGEEIGYTVSFDTQNHGIAPAAYAGITAGSTIMAPEEPTAERYIFLGWFKDAECTVLWDFATDTVDADITLYAGWKETGDNPSSEPDNDTEGVLPEDIPIDGIPQGLWIAGVKDYIYTGKAIKPEVRVYDGERRLKEKTDYTISYKNNTKANDASVEKTAPTIVVKGKGNYGGTETAVFKILPVDLNDTSVTVDDITLAFNNKVQKPIPIVAYNGKKLKNKTDFTISYPDLSGDNPNALKETGTYSLVISAKKDAKGNDTGNFTGTRTVTFVITDHTLIGRVAVKKIPNQTYTGTAIEPQLQVTYKNNVLILGTDYEVSYLNNTEIGTATVILTGINQYAGTRKVTYRIIGKPIKNAGVSAIGSIIYDGTAKCPKPQVSMDGTILEEGTDYQISWQNNTNAGKATMIISGIRKYSGSMKKTFQITAYDLQKDTQNQITGFNSEITAKYAKGGSKPDIELFFNGTKLTTGKDYTISYKNNKQVTTNETVKLPTIVITGKGNFKGNLSKTFTIMQKAFDDTGAPVTLTVADIGFVDKTRNYVSKPVLTDSDGKKLASGVDYEKDITYILTDGTILTNKDKVEAGTEIMLKVTGKGAYTGELIKTYHVTKSDFSKAKISIQAQTYTGKAITLDESDITVKIGKTTLTYGTDYEVLSGSYANNIKKGNASVIIVGKGSYGGSKAVKFKITAKKFSWFWRIFG